MSVSMGVSASLSQRAVARPFMGELVAGSGATPHPSELSEQSQRALFARDYRGPQRSGGGRPARFLASRGMAHG